MKGRIGADHSNQGDVGEIEALGDHLSAEQDPDLRPLWNALSTLVAAAAAHRVGIHPLGRKRREGDLDLAFEPLGADAAVVELGCAVMGARRRAGAFGIACMANQDVALFMVRRGHVAGVALDDFAASAGRERMCGSHGGSRAG